MRSIIIDEAKLNELAMNYDPAPIQQSLMQPGPAGAWPGMPLTAAQGMPWTPMMEGGGATPAGAPSPLNPQALGMLNSMMPQQQKPQFIGGAGIPHPQPFNLAIPNLQQQQKPSLGALMGVR